MINIFLNGKDTKLDKSISISEFLKSQNLDSKMIAVAINMKIIHKNEYDKTILLESDKVEIVRPVGGG